METPPSRPRGSALLEDPLSDTRFDADTEPDDPLGAAAPPVVAVVVATQAEGLRQLLSSLAAQDYPALSTLVFDTTGDEAIADLIADEVPDAYLRRLDPGTDYAQAVNEAIRAVEGAPFLLCCRDDASLAPDAVTMLVTEAFRSNAAVVGPKFVDAADPSVLVDVGLAIDRYGVPFSAIEPGEVDQEQHDSVRDVFFVDDAVVLVRADLFSELGGFDPACADSADLDLCWRARLAGARVIVAPAALVRRAVATRGSEATPAGRVRALLKSYSARSLLWVVPVAFVLDLVGALAALAGRNRTRAGALAGAWPRALVRFATLRPARREVQQRRVVEDGEVRVFMIRGSARLRTFLIQRLHADDRLADASVRAQGWWSRRAERAHRPYLIGLAVFVALLALGMRGLVFGGVAQVGSFVRWPSVSDALGDATSAWHARWLGTPGPGAPALVMMGLARIVAFGHGGLARTLLVVGAVPLGVLGVRRIGRQLSPSPYAAGAAMLAYAANPVARNAISEGRLGPLVAYALVPWVLAGMLAPADAEPQAIPVTDTDPARKPVARWARLTLAVAVTSAFWLPALAFAPLVALVMAVSVPVFGGRAAAARIARDAGVATVGAVVLLAPFSLRILDAASAGAVYRGERSFGAVLHFDTGPSGAGVLFWGLLIAAALPLIVARDDRLAWAGRAWLLALAGFVLAWLPTRIAPDAHVVAPEGPLVVAALGLALAVGIGVAAFIDELRTFLFGWRQVAAVLAALGLALPTLGFAADAWTGRYHQPSQDWADRIGWPPVPEDQAPWRVLWLGAPEVLGDSVPHDDLGSVISRGGDPDARDLWPQGDAGANAVPGRLIDEIRAGRTARLGRLLSSFGIRFIAVMDRAAPGATRSPLDPAITRSLDEQLDLALFQRETGLVIYENTDWTSPVALVPTAGALRAQQGRDASSLLRGALGRAVPVPGNGRSTEPIGPGGLFLGESYAHGWTARASGEGLTQRRVLGWANGFELTGRATVSWRYDRPLLGTLWLVLQPALWLVVLIAALPGLRTRMTARVRRRTAVDELVEP